jgi:hypothetical protein
VKDTSPAAWYERAGPVMRKDAAAGSVSVLVLEHGRARMYE